MKEIRLLDATLSESGRTDRAPFAIRQKLIIARSLDFLGIDAIEVGRPRISKEIDDFIAEVGGEQLKAELIVHAGACEEEVEAALESGIGRIAVSQCSTGLRFSDAVGSGLEQAARMVYESVDKITDNGRRVCFSVENAIRADMNVLIQLCQAAVEAGADSITLADSSGVAVPDEIRSTFLCVKSIFPDVSLSALCSNNLGLAVDNALAAMEGGAGYIHATLNSPSESAGITPLRHLAVALKVQYGIETLDMRSVDEIYRMVSKFSSAPMSVRACD